MSQGVLPDISGNNAKAVPESAFVPVDGAEDLGFSCERGQHE
jgi:hypothetical protein